MKLSAHMKWCPNLRTCQAHVAEPEQLRVKDMSATHRRKYCVYCKRYFEFIRSDTPEGRALKCKNWYSKNVSPTITKPRGTGPPKTAAERMRDMRERRKAQLDDTMNEAIGEVIE